MKLLLSVALALFFSMFFSGGEAAAQDDPRIAAVPYNASEVYRITISPGLASVVEFEKGEAVESVVVGDAAKWLVETTASADRVVIKPSATADTTNMVVITTKRTYAFLLSTYGANDTYVMRFTYSVSEKPASTSYRFRGEKSLYPRLMSDNGKTTSIYWSNSSEFPGVFILDEEGDEFAADSRTAGDGLIVEGVHNRYVFRLGKSKATAQRQVRETGG